MSTVHRLATELLQALGRTTPAFTAAPELRNPSMPAHQMRQNADEQPTADQLRGAVGWLLDYYGKPRSPWSAEEDQTDAAHRVLGDELAEKLVKAFSELAELRVRVAELEQIEQRAREMRDSTVHGQVKTALYILGEA